MSPARSLATWKQNRLWVVLLISSFLPTASFVPKSIRSNEIFQTPKLEMSSTANPGLDPASRFHSDMARVLESRDKMSSNVSLSISPLERRQRPALLTSDVDGAIRVASMLKHMVEIGVATETSYQIVLKAFADRGRLRWRRDDSTIVCPADEVGPLIDELWDIQNGELSTETCNLALKAYAICSTPRGNRNYAEKAQRLLENMKSSNIEVSVETLSHLVNAWSWQQENMESGKCAKMAQQNFDEMLKLSPDDGTVMQGYHWVLETWSKSSSSNAPERAEQIFNKMMDLKSKTGSKLDAQAYSNVILAWTKKPGEASAEKANELLLQMVDDFENDGYRDNAEPELIAFNGVISAWSRCGRMDKAEEILWLADGMRSTCESLCPDVVTYNSVLHGHIRGKEKSKSLDKMLSIVAHMEYNAEEQPEMKPDHFTFNTLLKAWVQSGREDAVPEAMKILQRMREVWSLTPSSRHFNVVINALAKSRNPDARKAYELLLQMQTLEGCDPDIISYTSVIECFSKSSDPEAAVIGTHLLDQVRMIYEETGEEQMMPNLRIYTMAIRALSINPTLSNVKTARDLLEELVNLYEDTGNKELRPNSYPYNYVLNCAANCIGSQEERLKAFQAAAKTYNEMRHAEACKPDSFTYAFWFKCCNNLLPVGDIRAKGVSLAFHQCCTDGLVATETLQRLLAGTPKDLVTKLLGIEEDTPPGVYRKCTLDDLPPNWSRNIR